MSARLARNIREYWRRQGYEVMVMVVADQGLRQIERVGDISHPRVSKTQTLVCQRDTAAGNRWWPWVSECFALRCGGKKLFYLGGGG